MTDVAHWTGKLAVAAVLLCVLYGWLNRRRGPEVLAPSIVVGTMSAVIALLMFI